MKPFAFSLALLGLTSVAHAGNDDSFFQSNEAALSGGAIIAGGTGPGMLWYNPAGLGANHRGRIEMNASAFTLRLRSVDDAFVVAGEGQDLRSVDFVTVPTALSMVRHLGRRVYAGVGSFVTRQDALNVELFRETAAGDSVTYSLESTVQQTNFGLGVGGRFGKFRMGGAVFFVLDNQTLSQTVSFVRESDDIDDASIALVDDNQASLDRLGLELVFGVQWVPIDALSIGFTLRGPRFRLKDTVVVNDTSVDAVGGPDGEADASRGRATADSSETTALLAYPIRAVLGVQVQSERVRVAIDAEYSPAYSQLSLTTWQAQWNLRAGVAIQLSENFDLGFGAFTDRFRGRELGPIIGADFYGGSAGITTRKRLAVREEGDIVFTTTISARYAIGIGGRIRGGDLNTTRLDDDGTVFFEPRLRSGGFHEISLYLGSGLDF